MLSICPIDISANSQHITAAHCTDSWDLSPSATQEGCIPTVCPWISINTPLDAHFIALLNHKAYVPLKFKTTFPPGLKLLQTKSYFGLWVTRCSHNIISSFLWQMLNGETLHSGSIFYYLQVLQCYWLDEAYSMEAYCCNNFDKPSVNETTN